MHQKLLEPYLYFKFAYRSKIINVLFLLRYPMIWSGAALASIISTPFWLHNFLSIAPISFFSLPHISFLLYFGAKTIWYWHLYQVKIPLTFVNGILAERMGFEPMCLLGKRFSRPPRYDRFDTSPYSVDRIILSQPILYVNVFLIFF